MNRRTHAKKIRDLSLRKKILRMAFMTIFITLTICLVFGSIYYSRAYTKKAQAQIHDRLDIAISNGNYAFKEAILCANNLSMTLSTISGENQTFSVQYSQIISALSTSLLLYDCVDSVCYVTDTYTYSSDYDMQFRQEEIVNSSFYQAAQEVKSARTHLVPSEETIFTQNAEVPVITMAKRVTKMNTGKTLGFLFINIKVHEVVEASDNNSSLYLLDPDNRYYTQSTNTADTAVLETYIDTELTGKTDDERKHLFPSHLRQGLAAYYVEAQALNEKGWQIVSVNNMHSYHMNILSFIGMLLLFGIGSYFAVSVFSRRLTRTLTDPFEELTSTVKELGEGNFDVNVNVTSSDEIGQLGQAFNQMAGQIKELMIRIDEEAKKKRSYELALIQEQIKPHFLYNSLDIIIVLNEMNKTKEATRVTRKLADYYRNTLSSSAEYIPLEKEFRILEDYLDLQLMRYEDKFTYNLSLAPDLADFWIPKMTLQPLVENALYHGLKQNENWGNIDVLAYREENCIILKVIDNGIGMTKSTIEKLNKLKEKPEEHFGVYSVLHRLELYYSDRCTMDIESTYYQGTTITLRIIQDPE